MTRPKRVLLALLIILATGTAMAEDPVVEGAKQLADQIARTYKVPPSGQKPKIAVLEFADLDGRVTQFGRLLSEELITHLFLGQRFDVVERLMLSKVIKENKLQMEGIVDPGSAKQLGKILGVDAIVSGTHAVTSDGLRINARVISTDTGSVFAVASTTISNAGHAAPKGQTAPMSTEILLQPSAVYAEDFSEVTVGLLPEGWQAQDEVMVRTLPNGSKALWANANGNYRAVVSTPTFPSNFRLTLRMLSRHWTGWHEEGQPITITLGSLTFVFRATGTVSSGNTSGKFPPVSDQNSNLVIEKDGAVVRFKVDGTEALLLRVRDFKAPSGFSIAWSKHTDDKDKGGTTLVLYEVRLEG